MRDNATNRHDNLGLHTCRDIRYMLWLSNTIRTGLKLFLERSNHIP